MSVRAVDWTQFQECVVTLDFCGFKENVDWILLIGLQEDLSADRQLLFFAIYHLHLFKKQRYTFVNI